MRGADGLAEAAVSISLPTARYSRSVLPQLVAALAVATADIEGELTAAVGWERVSRRLLLNQSRTQDDLITSTWSRSSSSPSSGPATYHPPAAPYVTHPRADGRRARADPAGTLAGGCEMSELASESMSPRLCEVPTERREGLR